MTLPRATAVETAEAEDHIALTYEARLVCRKRLTSAGGRDFLVDLPETISVNEGDCFVIDDGTRIAVRAAPEALLAITGDLARLAWHIGNRHTPCRIEPGRLLIQRDHVLAAMLTQLGAALTEVEEPFTPEGGAYGHGRTFGHSHGHTHGHVHTHGSHTADDHRDETPDPA